MIVEGMKKAIEKYDSIVAELKKLGIEVAELKKLGIEVEEVAGYSNHLYQFIGARDPSGSRTWLFTADTLHDFMEKTELFLMGYRMRDGSSQT